MRLIDADAVMYKILDLQDDLYMYPAKKYCKAVDDAYEIVKDAPTVDPVKHGHWVDRTTNDVIRLDGVVVHTDN